MKFQSKFICFHSYLISSFYSIPFWVSSAILICMSPCHGLRLTGMIPQSAVSCYMFNAPILPKPTMVEFDNPPRIASPSTLCYRHATGLAYLPYTLRVTHLVAVSLTLMTSQFWDIVNHKQNLKSVKCIFCDKWVQNFVWNFQLLFEISHKKIHFIRCKKFNELWYLIDMIYLVLVRRAPTSWLPMPQRVVIYCHS